MLHIAAHKSSSYAPRTYVNASQGVTLAIAVDFTTAGERLTTKAATGKILHVDADLLQTCQLDPLDVSRDLWRLLKKHNTSVLNVAGNGIYTYTKRGFTQEMVNNLVYLLLEPLVKHGAVTKVVSGGQSGADLAGLIAGAKLGIPACGLWPAGYKMRFENGVDVTHTPEQIMEIINQYA